MSDRAVHRKLEDILPHIRQPARLIGGEAGSGPGFTRHSSLLRVVLGFPDTYEIGISNQALQILYGIATATEGVEVERTYLPWVDAIAAMRREGIPLVTLETWSPVRESDLFAVTLQHEFNFTNLLEMLDLAGIPLLAAERGPEHPLVLAGGPACADFLPLRRFLDAVAIGDGESLFPEVLAVLAQARSEGVDATEQRGRLAEIAGVFVPRVSDKVVRRAVSRLEDAFYPDECIVPLTAGVHDRAWVEIMRGCTRGCRFCQAGMWYRPVRERSPGRTLCLAAAQLRSSGYQELALASLSTTDYSRLEQVLARLAVDHPEVRVSLPSLRVDSAAVRLAELASPTGPSLTLAPEAGSQRMRDIINKNVSETDILAAAGGAFRAGRTTLKLYFMIGLPWETDEDVGAIVDLCLKVRDLGRGLLGQRAGRVQLNISVNNFIPKPFTPFQWAGMADRATLARRQGILRARLRKPGVRLAMSGPDKSYLEAAIARGGEGMGAIIHEAWSRGARLDSWTEQFRADAWREAFETAGTSAEELATTPLALDGPLPWDLITGVVDRGYLVEEWRRAERGRTSPDCRWEGCSDCGACTSGMANDLAADWHGDSAWDLGGDATNDLETGTAGESSQVLGSRSAAGATSAAGTGPRWRYVAAFKVSGRGRFLGHLDRVEVFRKAVRKAGGRIALSAGMRPKPRLSLALPLAVGSESLHELAELELAEDPGPGFFERLAASLPEHIELTTLDRYHARRSLAARVVGASYEVMVDVAGACRAGGAQRLSAGDMLREAAGRFENAPALPLSETREGRTRGIDVKQYVDTVQVAGGGEQLVALSFRASITPSGTARPERVVQALAGLCGAELTVLSITRTQTHLTQG